MDGWRCEPQFGHANEACAEALDGWGVKQNTEHRARAVGV